MRIHPGTTVTVTGADNVGYQAEVYSTDKDSVVLRLPVMSGKPVILDKNTVWNLIVNADDGMFFTTALAEKQSSVFIRMKFLSDVRKYQRRRYFRLPCSLPAEGITVFKGCGRDTAEDLLKKGGEDAVVFGMVLNISGGGACITCKKDLDTDRRILLKILPDGENKESSITGKTFMADMLEKRFLPGKDLYLYRLSFMFDNEKDREKLINYVWKEQIRMQKWSGIW